VTGCRILHHVGEGGIGETEGHATIVSLRVAET
jgi:hypothetical protein